MPAGKPPVSVLQSAVANQLLLHAVPHSVAESLMFVATVLYVYIFSSFADVECVVESMSHPSLRIDASSQDTATSNHSIAI